MRLVIASTVLLLVALAGSRAFAADLALPKKDTLASRQPVATDHECLRFVEQTYSWYNYCDPIPYYGRNRYGAGGGLFSGN